MDTIRLELNNNHGYKWTCVNGVYCKGYAFLNGELLENEKLAEAVVGLDRLGVIETVSKLEGFFSFVVMYDNAVLAVCDHVRSFPLFYYEDNGTTVLFDSVDDAKISNFTVNEDTVKEYRGALYLLGKNTLFKDVFAVEAYGYFWKSGSEKVEAGYYDNFKYSEEQNKDIKSALVEAHKVYEDTFKRLIQYLDGRTAVIPLSGGHDSRLVAYYLVKLGYKNIIAFSYGDPAISDSQISMSVAETLGIRYYYIPYTRREMQKACKKYFDEYMVYSANGVSVPRIQTWYAVHWLSEHEIIDENSVFCAGYGGILPGHYVDKKFVDSEFISKKELIKMFEHEFFQLLSRTSYTYYEKFMDEFMANEEIAALPEKVPIKAAAEIFERWIYREDQGKGIQNANRMYELYGAKWATPFFEKSQFDFWAKIDNSLRYDNKLFKAMEKELFEGEITKIPFTGSKEQPTTNTNLGIIKKGLMLLDYAIHPRKGHYMNVMVPLKNHLYNTLVTRIRSPFHYVEQKYVKHIRKISQK